MRIQEYIFRSPYPQRVQIGIPENGVQNSQNNTKDATKLEQEKIKVDIVKDQTKSILGDKKLTPDINSLDMYA